MWAIIFVLLMQIHILTILFWYKLYLLFLLNYCVFRPDRIIVRLQKYLKWGHSRCITLIIPWTPHPL